MVTEHNNCWNHGFDLKTGTTTDVAQELYGVKVPGKVFVYPYGKGYVGTTTYILEPARRNLTPCAIINMETEMLITADIVLVDLLYRKEIPVGDKSDKGPLDLIKE